MKILTTMGAYDAAKDIYMYGKHSKPNGSYLTLQDLATSTSRDMVPQYKDFRSYFDDDNYADTIITKVMEQTFPFNDASLDQRAEIVVKVLSVMVLYMQVLQELYEAQSDCEAGVQTRSLDGASAWDKAAAYIIGSIETSHNGGSRWFEDGQLLYGLAKQRCIQFGTCDKTTGNADVNEELIELFYAGQSEAKTFTCNALRRTIGSIQPLLLTPLIQSTLRAAIENEDLTFFSTEVTLADGYVYSSSILPLIKAVDATAAHSIKKNMDFQFTVVPVMDGAGAVFSAMEAGIIEMKSVDCSDIGSIQSMDVCGGSKRSSATPIAKISIISTMACFLVSIIFMK